jgi:anti-sigma regulatory factor (Ser/Thr protein kinase)
MSCSPMSGGTGAVWADERSGVRRTAESSTPVPVLPPPAWLHISTLELTALPTAVACGRLHAKHILWEWQLDTLADDAEILVSELLTNAVKATWSPDGAGLVALRLMANRRQLLIEVWDQSPHDPRPMSVSHDPEHGRGFMVINGLSSRWGHHRVSTNLKVVWCELVIVSC